MNLIMDCILKSHKYMGAERTALVLNNNKPFRLNKEFILSFDMSLRNGFIFGTVFENNK